MNRKKNNGIRNIANIVGVSPATVSRALNNSGLVSPELQRRIVEASRQLGNNARNNLQLIAFIVSDENHRMQGYTLRVIEELRRESAQRGYFWELISADELDLLNERSVAGVVSLDYRNRVAEKWSSQSFPLVCINDAARYLDGVYAVYSDESSAIEHAVNHLIGFGHRRIGLLQIGWKSAHASRHREEAFFQLGERYRCREGFHSEWGCVPVDDATCPTVVDGALDNLLRERVSAVIIPGESAVFDLLAAMKRRNLPIGKRLSVIAWESHAARFLTPPLTTVEQNFSELARLALDILEAQLRHGTMPKNREVPYLFHLRESVTVPPGGSKATPPKKS